MHIREKNCKFIHFSFCTHSTRPAICDCRFFIRYILVFSLLQLMTRHLMLCTRVRTSSPIYLLAASRYVCFVKNFCDVSRLYEHNILVLITRPNGMSVSILYSKHRRSHSTIVSLLNAQFVKMEMRDCCSEGIYICLFEHVTIKFAFDGSK